MAAYDAVHAALPGVLNHGRFVIRHVLHRRLGFQLDVRSERPITESKGTPKPIDPHIPIQDQIVKRRSEPIEPPIEVGKAVELVSVNDEIAFAIGGCVHETFHEPDRSELDAEEFLQEFVVIPAQEGHARLFAVLSQQFLDEDIVLVGPVPLPAQLPAVDEITHDVKMVAVRFAKKLKQPIHLGMFRAQMNVGNPYGAILHGFGLSRGLLRQVP